MEAGRRVRVGEPAVLFLAAGFAEAVRALGCAGIALLYGFAASAIVLVCWLFLLAG